MPYHRARKITEDFPEICNGSETDKKNDKDANKLDGNWTDQHGSCSRQPEPPRKTKSSEIEKRQRKEQQQN